MAAAEAPARPEPTTMMVYLRLLAGFTSFISKRAWSHSFSMGPAGTLESRCMSYLTHPASTETGMEMFPAAISMATAAAPRLSARV